MRRLLVVLALPLHGCWLTGTEWAVKRQEAAENALPSPVVVPVPDLGLGSCVAAGYPESNSGVWLDENPVLAACGGGPEARLAWNVPDDACWLLDTEGSTLLAGVSVMEGCAEDPLVCTTEPSPIVGLERGPVLVVLEGPTATQGDWQLLTTPLFDVDLGTTLSAAGDTSGQETVETFACVPGGRSGKVTYLKWFPPTAGEWTFSVAATFHVQLSVHQDCAFDADQACSEGPAGETEVTVRLDAGEEVLVRIGGAWPADALPAAGSWALQINAG